ncbi:hypothetical protein RFK95_00580 [Acinetobacter pittii]|uniref:Uncharacterized protein n=1 Tax=Acinetobacter pittii TaxID=48296 RepID=A0AB37TMV6_ACIPI|nr:MULTISPECIES: hypothetical protein [Acinetobacter]MDR0069062.1 hypothetical protein [Acinetobacter sp. 11520]MDU6285631.1 hypothetical protein [Acinetobacter sp.]EXB00884.1 hypothetical protein J507_0723 [Acinetobacter sp. 1295259]MBM0875151.1 hypothetical protein [Acinetobacter pittii]MCG9484315.1 hypothetical protein [Acinetobacter pittii]
MEKQSQKTQSFVTTENKANFMPFINIHRKIINNIRNSYFY